MSSLLKSRSDMSLYMIPDREDTAIRAPPRARGPSFIMTRISRARRGPVTSIFCIRRFPLEEVQFQRPEYLSLQRSVSRHLYYQTDHILQIVDSFPITHEFALGVNGERGPLPYDYESFICLISLQNSRHSKACGGGTSYRLLTAHATPPITAELLPEVAARFIHRQSPGGSQSSRQFELTAIVPFQVFLWQPTAVGHQHGSCLETYPLGAGHSGLCSSPSLPLTLQSHEVSAEGAALCFKNNQVLTCC